MAKKKIKKIKSKKAHPDLHHYCMALKLSQRNVKNDGSDIDDYFKKQVEKFKKLIEDIK